MNEECVLSWEQMKSLERCVKKYKLWQVLFINGVYMVVFMSADDVFTVGKEAVEYLEKQLEATVYAASVNDLIKYGCEGEVLCSHLDF